MVCSAAVVKDMRNFYQIPHVLGKNHQNMCAIFKKKFFGMVDETNPKNKRERHLNCQVIGVYSCTQRLDKRSKILVNLVLLQLTSTIFSKQLRNKTCNNATKAL